MTRSHFLPVLVSVSVGAAAILFLALPAAGSHSSVDIEACFTHEDFYDGVVETPWIRVRVMFQPPPPVLGDPLPDPELHDPPSPGDWFQTDKHGCWSGTVTTAGTGIDEPDFLIWAITRHDNLTTAMEGSLIFTLTKSAPQTATHTAATLTFNHQMPSGVDVGISQDNANDVQSTARSHYYGYHLRNWTIKELGLPFTPLNMRPSNDTSSGPASQPGLGRILGNLHTGEAQLGHEMGHLIYRNIRFGDPFPSEDCILVDTTPELDCIDPVHGDYRRAEGSPPEEILYPRCSEADPGGAWQEGFSDYIGALFHRELRTNDDLEVHLVTDLTTDSVDLLIDYPIADPFGARSPACPASSTPDPDRWGDYTASVASTLWRFTESLGFDTRSDIIDVYAACPHAIGSLADFLRCGEGDKTWTDRLARSAWRRHIDIVPPDTPETTVGRNHGSADWIRRFAGPLEVEHEDPFLYVERVEAYYGRNTTFSPQPCFLGEKVEPAGKGAIGQHDMDIWDDRLHDFTGDTALYYDDEVAVVNVCARSSHGLSRNGDLQWGPLDHSDWELQIDNQDPYVEGSVRDPRTASTGVWIIDWYAHDSNGSLLCCNVNIYEVDTPACAENYHSQAYTNPDYGVCNPTLLCSMPHDQGTTDPTTYAPGNNWSMEIPLAERPEWRGGCVVDTGSSTPPCIVVEAEDRARSDVPLAFPEDGGNLGHGTNVNPATGACFTKEVSTPGLPLVATLVVVAALAVLGRRRASA